MRPTYGAFANAVSPRNNAGQAVTPAQNPPFFTAGLQQTTQVSPVADPHRYPRIIRGRVIVDTLAGGAVSGYNPLSPFLNASKTLRNYLYLRVSSMAANPVGVSFGQPTDTTNPDYLLYPGGYLGWDTCVPQDDIYAVSMWGGVGVSTALLLYNYSTVQIDPSASGG